MMIPIHPNFPCLLVIFFLGWIFRSEDIGIRDKRVFFVPLDDGESGQDVEVGEVGTLFEEEDAGGGVWGERFG
jgi:hypothetical protein